MLQATPKSIWGIQTVLAGLKEREIQGKVEMAELENMRLGGWRDGDGSEKGWGEYNNSIL